MIYDCSRALQICIWKRSSSAWDISWMEPNWFQQTNGNHELKDGDIINLNKDCRLDINGRVSIKDNTYELFRYGNDVENIKLIINIVPIPDPINENERMLREEFSKKRINNI